MAFHNIIQKILTRFSYQVLVGIWHIASSVLEWSHTEINDVGAHAPALRAVGAREGRGAVLQRRVLLADRRVLQVDVAHLLVAAYEECRLAVDVKDWQRFVSFERIESENTLSF